MRLPLVRRRGCIVLVGVACLAAEGLVAPQRSAARGPVWRAAAGAGDSAVVDEAVGLLPPTEPSVALDASARTLESAVGGAVRGEKGPLLALLSPGVTWTGPVAKAVGGEAVLAALDEATAWFEAADRRFTVLGQDVAGAKETVRWVASATLANAWRPRVRIFGMSVVERDPVTGLILAVEDAWDKSPSDLFADQVLPRLWDLYDLFNTPAAERPFTVVDMDGKGGVASALPRGFHVETVRQEGGLFVRCALSDVTNSRAMRLASALPDFAFIDDTVGQKAKVILPETMVSPLTVRVEVVPGTQTAEGKPVRRCTWDIPVHSRFGTDPSELPPLRTADQLAADTYVREGWATDPAIAYVRKDRPNQRFLVRTFDGDVQDADAEPAKRSLVEAATAACLPFADPPVFEHRRHRAKVGFDDEGNINFAAYFPKRPLPVDQNQLALLLD